MQLSLVLNQKLGYLPIKKEIFIQILKLFLKISEVFYQILKLDELAISSWMIMPWKYVYFWDFYLVSNNVFIYFFEKFESISLSL